MHTDISQEAFCAATYRENARRFRYHLDRTPGLNTYRKNPSVWTHCFGNKTNIIHHAEMQGNYISETLQKKDSQTSKYTAKMSSGSGNK
jgi:hypothetical protein